MHRLLQRQLRKATAPDGELSLDDLMSLVSQTYEEAERNRMRADRANELMAAELTEMLTLRDVSDRLTREKAVAEAASRAKSQFIANMSHELRTPLNAVIGYTELMSEEAREDCRWTDVDDHGRVLAAARALLHLIDDILDLAKVEGGKLEVSIEDFDLTGVLQGAVDTVRHAASAQNTTIELEIASGLGVVRNDPYKLTQCVLNLLSNAAKFTKDGRIAVRAWRTLAPDQVHIEVADTGIGMSPDQVRRVFKAFEQADASITRKYGGTGLGLTITQSLAKLLGGDIAVESELGKGSCFTLSVAADLSCASVSQMVAAG